MAEYNRDSPITSTQHLSGSAGDQPVSSRRPVPSTSGLLACLGVVAATAFLLDFQNQALPIFVIACLSVILWIGLLASRHRIDDSSRRIDILAVGDGVTVLLITALAIMGQGLNSLAIYLFILPLVYLATGFPLRSVIWISAILVTGYVIVVIYSIFSLVSMPRGLSLFIFQVLWLATGIFLAYQQLKDTQDVVPDSEPDNDRQQILDTLDDLTGCLNQRSFFNELARENSRAMRYKETFALLIIDIDNLTRLNEEHGYHTGDHVLEQIGATLRQIARQADQVGRIGGDEIAVLAPQTNHHEAKLFAKRILNNIPEDLPPLGVTLSIGISDSKNGLLDETTLYWRANHALNHAKTFTGNNTVVWDESLSEEPKVESTQARNDGIDLRGSQ